MNPSVVQKSSGKVVVYFAIALSSVVYMCVILSCYKKKPQVLSPHASWLIYQWFDLWTTNLVTGHIIISVSTNTIWHWWMNTLITNTEKDPDYIPYLVCRGIYPDSNVFSYSIVPGFLATEVWYGLYATF